MLPKQRVLWVAFCGGTLVTTQQFFSTVAQVPGAGQHGWQASEWWPVHLLCVGENRKTPKDHLESSSTPDSQEFTPAF